VRAGAGWDVVSTVGAAGRGVVVADIVMAVARGGKQGWMALDSTWERHFFSSSRRRTRVRLTRLAVDGSFRESPSVQVL